MEVRDLLLQTALLVFLSASAWTWIVAANLCVSERRLGLLLAAVYILPWDATRRQGHILWCRRDTVGPQAEGNFHIFCVAGNRDIDRTSVECIPDYINRLDRLQIDQSRHRNAADQRIHLGL